MHLQAVSALKQEQKAFFAEIAHVLAEQARQQETSQLLAFITGAGGTGKSYLLKMIRDRIKLVLDSNQHKSALVLAAPKGFAALNIIGTTLH